MSRALWLFQQKYKRYNHQFKLTELQTALALTNHAEIDFENKKVTHKAYVFQNPSVMTEPTSLQELDQVLDPRSGVPRQQTELALQKLLATIGGKSDETSIFDFEASLAKSNL